MTVGIIGHYRCAEHDMGEHHPENGKRLDAISDQLIRSGLEYVIRQFDSKPIDKSLFALAHTQDHIDFVYDNAPQKDEGYFTAGADAVMNDKTLTSILYSAGAAVDAVDLVMDKKLRAAFCLTRPPGHHATRNKSMEQHRRRPEQPDLGRGTDDTKGVPITLLESYEQYGPCHRPPVCCRGVV